MSLGHSFTQLAVSGEARYLVQCVLFLRCPDDMVDKHGMLQ